METEVMYFGYGANRSSYMMKAIIGRNPIGFPAKLEDYELCIQTWDEIPEKVRKVFRYPELLNRDFKSYCIRPAGGKMIVGRVWSLTRLERELVDNWELNGLWYEPIRVHVFSYDGQIIEAETEMINNPSTKQVVNGRSYQTFLNRKEVMWKVARKVREAYLQEKLS